MSNEITWDVPLLPARLAISGVYSISFYKIWIESSHYLKLVHLFCSLDIFPSGGVVQIHRPSTWEAEARGLFTGLRIECQSRLCCTVRFLSQGGEKKEETITKSPPGASPQIP